MNKRINKRKEETDAYGRFFLFAQLLVNHHHPCHPQKQHLDISPPHPQQGRARCPWSRPSQINLGRVRAFGDVQ